MRQRAVSHNPKTLIVQQLLAFLVAATVSAELPKEAESHAILRGQLKVSQHKFEKQKTGHVAFLGGSITANAKGHSAMIPAWLEERYPDTKFTFTNAGISSTCSHTGAFRLIVDVLFKCQVDLLVVEFAVNDDQDAGHSRVHAIRGMEGVIRRLKAHNPGADVLDHDHVG
ncbi:MAG: SGNH/GDSL hydrolase family protein, partial [Verrucomicrobiota bacterium]